MTADPKPSSAFTAVIDADLFRRVSVARSTEETRYHLNGVNVEACKAGGAIMVATDGRRMLVIHDPNGLVVGQGIVSLTPAMMRALKAPASTKNPRRRWLAVNAKRAAVIELETVMDLAPDAAALLLERVDAPDHTVVAYQWSHTTIDGNFPHWRRVVKQPAMSKPSLRHPPLDMSLLGPIAMALDTGTDGKGRVQVIAMEDATDYGTPQLIFADVARQIGFGIIMPFRAGEPPTALPAWAGVAPPEPTKKGKPK